MTAYAVIGSSFGDEGKGLLTDYLCARENARWCVRFNSGAQAGHSVQLADGRRHVFHHFGAGTVAGAATYLGPEFVVNPALFMQEYRQLKELGIRPQVWIDPDCLVTTVWDMIINQAMEDARGPGRHGSCGIGFGETLHRSSCGYHFYADDLLTGFFSEMERRVRADQYMPERLKELGLELPSGINLNALRERFLDDCARMASVSNIKRPRSLDGNLVFEGAQGLLLDQRHHSATNPHVTRSHTGLRNVAEICNEFGIEHLTAVYVTRTYLTRHGAGPLENEYTKCPFPYFLDRTNVSHPYQGELRLAPLDVVALRDRIAEDFHDNVPRFDDTLVTHTVAVTCMDHYGGSLPALINQLPVSYVSHGPQRSDIRNISIKGNDHAIVRSRNHSEAIQERG